MWWLTKYAPFCVSVMMLPRRTQANKFFSPLVVLFRRDWFSPGVVSCLTILSYDPPDSPLVWSLVEQFSSMNLLILLWCGLLSNNSLL